MKKTVDHERESVIGYVVTRLRYLFKTKVAFHALCHCMIVATFYNLVAYPLTLRESELLSDHEDTNGLLCKGLLRNLMNQGGFLNATFLIGSVLFAIFIVPCRPHPFYSKMFPFLGTILIGSLVVLWFKLPPVATFIFVSIAQVTPYYLRFDPHCD